MTEGLKKSSIDFFNLFNNENEKVLKSYSRYLDKSIMIFEDKRAFKFKVLIFIICILIL